MNKTITEFRFTPEYIGSKNGEKLYGCTIHEDEGLILYEIYDRERNNELINDFIQIGRECGLDVVDIKEIMAMGASKGNVVVTDKVSGRSIVLKLCRS